MIKNIMFNIFIPLLYYIKQNKKSQYPNYYSFKILKGDFTIQIYFVKSPLLFVYKENIKNKIFFNHADVFLHR